jgi:capsular polysaccharide biosynthesis protein
MSRSTGHANNAGRKILNEAALLDAIETLLVERGQGEELLIFDEAEFGSFAAAAAFLHANVRAVVGPHGGGLYHHRFAGPDTLVLEFQPETVHEAMFWEEAPLLSQVYRPMSFPVADGQTDFDVGIEAVIEVLAERLGRRDERGASVTDAYQWTSAELGLGTQP